MELARVNGAVLWMAFLDDELAASGEGWSGVSEAEREYAAACAEGSHRLRYLASRWFLRKALAENLGVPPESLRFESDSAGRPRLVSPEVPPGFDFNLSHCDEVILLAIGREGRVGVDIERVRERPRLEQLVAHTFSEREQEVWRRLPQAQRLRAFFKVWTAKEAVLKAEGCGMSVAPREIEIALSERNARARCLKGEDFASTHLVHLLEPAPDLVGALAVRKSAGLV